MSIVRATIRQPLPVVGPDALKPSAASVAAGPFLPRE